MELFRNHGCAGCQIGGDAFIEKLEWLLERELKSKKSAVDVKDKYGVPEFARICDVPEFESSTFFQDKN